MALSPRQWQTLTAVCDTLIPGAGPSLPRQIVEVLSTTSDPRDLGQFRQALTLLDFPLVGALLHGRAAPFSRLPVAEREAVLRRWATHPLAPMRQAFQAFKRLSGFIYASAPDSPLWREIGYAVAATPSPADATLLVEPLRPGESLLDADAVVVGSGAGGGVAAAELAARGLRVVVLEKAPYLAEAQLGAGEAQGMQQLYMDRGMAATRDLSVAVLAGSAVGGGTLVNWTACIAPPDWLRAEWEQEYGLAGLTSQAFQSCVDEVSARLGVNSLASASLPQSSAGRLLEGCRALGYNAAELPRNVGACGEDCGFCVFGCPRGSKQSTARTFLVDAVERGARVIPGVDVQQVIIRQGRVEGVAATVDGRPVTVRAPRVIMAAGAIGTPTILLRSGLDNDQVGRNLHLHPVVAVLGRYAEPVRPWSGRLLPAYSNQFAHVDGNYGFLLEVAPIHPGLGASFTPWQSASQYRSDLSRLHHTGVFIVLVRDRGSGRVSVDRQGRRRIDYVVSAFDKRHLLLGQTEAIKVHAAAGAGDILTMHSSVNLLRSTDTDAVIDFAQRSADLPSGPNLLPVFSAHQMGTCRMGASPRSAAADPTGQIYGVKGLYVTDGSAFPAASGVNPMITIMSLALWNARQIS